MGAAEHTFTPTSTNISRACNPYNNTTDHANLRWDESPILPAPVISEFLSALPYTLF